MIQERNDELKSWGISVFVHGLLLFIAMFWIVATKPLKIPDVIEVAFIETEAAKENETPPVATPPVAVPNRTNAAPPAVQRSATPKPSNVQAATQQRAREATARNQTAPQQSTTPTRSGASSVPVPPRQQRGMEETALPAFGAGKSPSTTASDRGATSAGKTDTRESDLPSSGSTRDGAHGVQGTQSSPITSDPGELSGTPATASNIDWGSGPSRNRIAGSMPVFPPGINREAKIKVRFTVKPDGSVWGITFLQKGEPAFENAVLRAMRTWKFNALPGNMNQADQNAIATFNFQLR